MNNKKLKSRINIIAIGVTLASIGFMGKSEFKSQEKISYRPLINLQDQQYWAEDISYKLNKYPTVNTIEDKIIITDTAQNEVVNPPLEINIQSENKIKTKESIKVIDTVSAFPHNTFKSYMTKDAIAVNSSQGKLCAKAIKDPQTAIMKVNDRYLVALGFAYSDRIGEDIDVVMDSGEIIPVKVGDWKAKEDTDKWNSASTNNGSIIEFIVASNELAGEAVNGSGNYDTIFSGKIKEFRKLDLYK